MRERSERSIFKYFLVSIFALTFFTTRVAQADPTKEFVLSCTYGVLAGTLVGAASLAFADKPGDSLNLVARGASLGLYAGILLGLYVVYGVPNEEDEEALKAVGGASNLEPVTHRNLSLHATLPAQPKFLVAPIMSPHGVSGAQAQMTVANF